MLHPDPALLSWQTSPSPHNNRSPSSHTQEPFSRLGLIQEGATLLDFSKAFNRNDCFLCAVLGLVPLSAVPFMGPRADPPTKGYHHTTRTPLLELSGHSLPPLLFWTLLPLQYN